MKVLIGVLGRPPEQYQKVQWHFKGRWKTAGFPAEVIAQEENVDHFLVAIPDSLTPKKHTEDERASRELGNYSAFQESRRIYVHRIQWGTAPTPLVLPSRYAHEVEGRGLDFYYASLFHLLQWWIHQDIPPHEDIEFLLESSTGMNMFSLLMYRAVLDTVRVLAYTRNVTFLAYTADAVSPHTREATIYATETLEPVIPVLPQDTGQEEYLFSQVDRTMDSYRKDPSIRELDKQLRDHWSIRNLWAFLGSVRHGLPLGMLTWLPPSPDNVLETLQQLYKFFLEKTLKTRREDHPKPFWYRPLALTALWRSYALGLLLAFEIHQRFAAIVQAWARHQGATVEEMRLLVDHMFQHAPVLSNRFTHEIETLRMSDDKVLSTPHLLNEIWYETPCERRRKGKINVNPRNFFAHAGFERCAVEVFRDPEGKVRFRYAEGAKETIMGWLR